MKTTKFFFFLLTISAIFLFVTCKPREENKIPPNCFDGELNNGEIKIDCGGPNCEECDHCANGVWEPARGETWRDCGGTCPICPTCANGIQDNGETGIDCGGDCGGCELLCADGLLNGFEVLIDCDTSLLNGGGCELCPNCNDGIMNGDETGIDCGGDSCRACCSSGSCRNGLKDGEEFYNDCGGNICEDCPDTLFWSINDTSYYTPSYILLFDNGVSGDTLIIADNQGFLTDPTAPLMPMGTLSMQFTKPPLFSWAQFLANVNSTIDFPSAIYLPDFYFINYVDANGNGYSSSETSPQDPTIIGAGSFTLDGYDTIEIPDDNFDGCVKTPGTYTYYRIRFSGTLVSGSNFAEEPSIAIEGTVIFTEKP